MSHMAPELHLYLCSYAGHMFEAPANSIDRTREVRCPACAVWDEEGIIERLKGMTA